MVVQSGQLVNRSWWEILIGSNSFHFKIISVVLVLDWITICSFSVLGYGQTGPMVQRGGYDSIAAAVSGLMHITGHEVQWSTFKFNRIFGIPYSD